MYEREESIELDISTFNLTVDLDDELTDQSIGLWLRPNTAKLGEAVHFQTAVDLTPQQPSAVASAKATSECRLEIAPGTAFDATNISIDASQYLLKIVLPKRSAKPKPLRVKLNRVGGE